MSRNINISNRNITVQLREAFVAKEFFFGDPTGSILQHLYDLFTSLPGLVSVIPSSFINIQTL